MQGLLFIHVRHAQIQKNPSVGSFFSHQRISQRATRTSRRSSVEKQRDPRAQGGTLIFSYIRRLGSFFGVQNFDFNIFWGFQKSSIGATLGSMTSRLPVQDGSPLDFRSKMAAPTTSGPRWRPHGVRSKVAAPRSQDDGPCDAFGYTSEGESTP